MNYNDFYYEFLDKELNQQQESADADSDYVFLSYNEGINYTNETIKECFEDNDAHWIREESFYFNGATTYLDIPAIYHRIHGYYNTDDKAWRIPSDASDMYADVRVVSGTKLYFRTEQDKGDSIMLRASVYPPDILQGSDTVHFPKSFLRYLRLRIMAKALGKRGKQWNELIQREFLLQEAKFMKYGQPVKRGTRITARGAGFGY